MTTLNDLMRPVGYRFIPFLFPLIVASGAAGAAAEATHPGSVDRWYSNYRQTVPAASDYRPIIRQQRQRANFGASLRSRGGGSGGGFSFKGRELKGLGG